jgi:hypothetical protein
LTTSSKPHPAHLPRLLGDVAVSDQLALGVDRHDPRDEQQAARLDRIGVVAHRLGQPLDPILLAMVRHHPDRTIAAWIRSSFTSRT